MRVWIAAAALAWSAMAWAQQSRPTPMDPLWAPLPTPQRERSLALRILAPKPPHVPPNDRTALERENETAMYPSTSDYYRGFGNYYQLTFEWWGPHGPRLSGPESPLSVGTEH